MHPCMPHLPTPAARPSIRKNTNLCLCQNARTAATTTGALHAARLSSISNQTAAHAQFAANLICSEPSLGACCLPQVLLLLATSARAKLQSATRASRCDWLAGGIQRQSLAAAMCAGTCSKPRPRLCACRAPVVSSPSTGASTTAMVRNRMALCKQSHLFAGWLVWPALNC